MVGQYRLADLISQAGSQGLAVQLAKGGIASIVIKVANTALALAMAIILARMLGPDGYGTYTYVFVAVSVMAIPAQFGLSNLVIRETARAYVNEQWGRIWGLWRWASVAGLLFALGISAVALFGLWLIAGQLSNVLMTTFAWGLLLIPLTTLGALPGAALQGLRAVILGLLSMNLLRPGLFFISIVICIVFGEVKTLNAMVTMSVHVVAAGVALIIAVGLLRWKIPTTLLENRYSTYETRAWFSTAWPLSVTAGMQQVINYSDVIILGILGTTSDVGVYRVAFLGSMLVVFGLQAVASIVSPYFARLHAEGDMKRLQRLAVISSRMAILIALPLTFLFAAFGDDIIRIAFGAQYVGAHTPLVILSVGRLANAFFGPINNLLNMTGYERVVTKGVATAAVTNIVLNTSLIPQFGMTGAAIASTLTLVLWNVLLWSVARRYLGIDSFAVQFSSKSKCEPQDRHF